MSREDNFWSRVRFRLPRGKAERETISLATRLIHIRSTKHMMCALIVTIRGGTPFGNGCAPLGFHCTLNHKREDFGHWPAASANTFDADSPQASVGKQFDREHPTKVPSRRLLGGKEVSRSHVVDMASRLPDQQQGKNSRTLATIKESFSHVPRAPTQVHTHSATLTNRDVRTESGLRYGSKTSATTLTPCATSTFRRHNKSLHLFFSVSSAPRHQRCPPNSFSAEPSKW